MICKKNIPMKSREIYELTIDFQRMQCSRADQRFRAPYRPTGDNGLRWPYSVRSKLETKKDLFMHLDVCDFEHRRLFTMMWQQGSRLPIRLKVRGFPCRLSFWNFSWEEGANCGRWKSAGPKWVCWLRILQVLLILIRVPLAFLLVDCCIFIPW